MDDLTNMFLQRQNMDTCGINAVLGVNSDNQIVDLSVSSSQDCTMTLSGGAVVSGSGVRMETVGVETTAYIDLAQTTRSFTFQSPIAM
jgi:aspartate aminotransferase-like enzyme